MERAAKLPSKVALAQAAGAVSARAFRSSAAST
jgi:hypothetical protein